VTKLPTKSDLASHCHKRLTNTKRKQEVWKRIKENGGKDPQVSEFSFFSCALAPYLVPKKLSPGFFLLFPSKCNTVMFFDNDYALS